MAHTWFYDDDLAVLHLKLEYDDSLSVFHPAVVSLSHGGELAIGPRHGSTSGAIRASAATRIMKWCEDHGVGFVLGLARNRRLVRALRAARCMKRTAFIVAPARRPGASATSPAGLASPGAASGGWSARRNICRKGRIRASWSPDLSPRKAAARRLYEKLYCARGEMENRIKEQQLDLSADRTSAHWVRVSAAVVKVPESAF